MSITFDPSGGFFDGTTAPTSITIPQGTTLRQNGRADISPTKDGHRFNGWFMPNGVQFTVDTPIHGNITVTASWTLLRPDDTWEPPYEPSYVPEAAPDPAREPSVPTVIHQPADQTAAVGGDVVFRVQISGVPAPMLQWQVSTDNGATWVNIQGRTRDTLTLTNITLNMDGNLYRVVITNRMGTVVSHYAVLRVAAPTPAAPDAALVTENDRRVSAVRNPDGSVTVTADVIETSEGSPFVLGMGIEGILTEPAHNTSNIVMTRLVDGNWEILPLSLLDRGRLRGITTSAGTFSAMYNPVIFTDISGHWARNFIEFAAARQIFNGMGDGTFAPDEGMTRAMFVTVLANLKRADVSEFNGTRFADVDLGAWYAPIVEWAAENNIAQGAGENMFYPNAVITHEQMAVMLMNYVTLMGFYLPTVQNPDTFADTDTVSWWAAEDVETLRIAGILTAAPGDLFNPQMQATRAAVATMFTMFVFALLN